MKRPGVRALVSELESKTTERLGITAEYVLNEAKGLYEDLRGEIRRLLTEAARLELEQGDPDAIADPEERIKALEARISKRIPADLAGRAIAALDLLGKHRTIAAWKEIEQHGGASVEGLVESLERAMDRVASSRLKPEDVGLREISPGRFEAVKH